MSDYTPSVNVAKAHYTGSRYDEDQVASIEEAHAEFDRFIAKVKADALREAAKDMRGHVNRAREGERFTEHELIEHDVEHVLNEYAELIEGEA